MIAAVALWFQVATAFAALVAIWRVVPRGLFRGRYISRPTIRLLGFPRAALLRLGLLVGLAVVCWTLVFADGPVVDWIGHVLGTWWNLWLIDDWLFTDRKPRRKHEWARIRLRMPKPVKLRPAERWAPSPA